MEGIGTFCVNCMKDIVPTQKSFSVGNKKYTSYYCPLCNICCWIHAHVDVIDPSNKRLKD